MALSFRDVAELDPEVARTLVGPWIVAHADLATPVRDELQAKIDGLMAGASVDAIRGLLGTFGRAGSDYELLEADPIGRQISRSYMRCFVEGASVSGVEALRAAVHAGPTLLLSNHQSYVDTQLTDHLLVAHGAQDVADPMIAVAGPKVYGEPFRRMAAICLTTLPTVQSSSLAHNESGMSPREVGRIAIQTVHKSRDYMASGRPVLVYAEGARTRTGQLEPFLKGVSKYAAEPTRFVVPVAIAGGDQVFPMDAPTMRPAHVDLVFCEPIDLALFGRQGVIEEAWRRVAAALPPSYRPGPDVAALI